MKPDHGSEIEVGPPPPKPPGEGTSSPPTHSWRAFGSWEARPLLDPARRGNRSRRLGVPSAHEARRLDPARQGTHTSATVMQTGSPESEGGSDPHTASCVIISWQTDVFTEIRSTRLSPSPPRDEKTATRLMSMARMMAVRSRPKITCAGELRVLATFEMQNVCCKNVVVTYRWPFKDKIPRDREI